MDENHIYGSRYAYHAYLSIPPQRMGPAPFVHTGPKPFFGGPGGKMMSEEEVKHLLREVELEIEREPHQTGKLYYKGARRALRMVLKLEGELTHGT